MSPSDLDAYVRRLGFERPLTPDPDTLRSLHRAHLATVPFENASVLFGERIDLDQAAFVRKLGRQGRGGFCYELNGAFAALLTDAGFPVSLLEARTYSDGGRLGPRFDHLALRVELDEPWLADVGFGFSFLEPLRLTLGDVQRDPMGRFRLDEADDGIDVVRQHRDGRWLPHYRFDPVPHELADFAEMCAYQQTSPDSHFIREWNCSLLGDDGAITLFGHRVIESGGGTRSDRDLTDAELQEILATRFGIHARRDGDRWVREAGR